MKKREEGTNIEAQTKLFENYNPIIRTKEECVEILKLHQLVAIYQGSSEIGPRALGNRSLMFDPTHPNCKEIVNTIKKREEFRPFAGSILLEDAHKYFEMGTLKESPYMTFAIPAKPKAHEMFRGIIHLDNTCRIQTVTREQNKNYYDVIAEFKKQTGCPMVFNTSFNLGGDAMVETWEQAISTLNRSAINFIYVPEDQTHLDDVISRTRFDEKQEKIIEVVGKATNRWVVESE